MAAQRQDSYDEGFDDSYQHTGTTPVRSATLPADGLDAARGIGWGLLLTVTGFWVPMLVLTWRWLHR